jgi:hypothetical protein
MYAAYQALREYSPEKKPTEIARIVGEALYVPPLLAPQEKWIEVEFAVAGGVQPVGPIVIRAKCEDQVRAEIAKRSRIVLWRTRPCDPPEQPKHKPLGNSPAAIAKQVMRLTKALGER